MTIFTASFAPIIWQQHVDVCTLLWCTTVLTAYWPPTFQLTCGRRIFIKYRTKLSVRELERSVRQLLTVERPRRACAASASDSIQDDSMLLRLVAGVVYTMRALGDDVVVRAIGNHPTVRGDSESWNEPRWLGPRWEGTDDVYLESMARERDRLTE